MASYYKQVCSSCSATESNGWKKVEELGTWVCCDCFDDIIAENVSSDEEVTREISTRRYTRVTRSAKICPQQSVSSNQSERGRRWIFKRRMPLKAFKTAYHPYTSNSLQYNGFLYKAGDVVKVYGGGDEFCYAQLRKFLTVARRERSASVLWLQPKDSTDNNSETDFDPSDYSAGTEDGRPLRLDAITFVMRLPLDYFKSYLTPFPHTPIEPEQSETIHDNFPKIVQLLENEVKRDVTTMNPKRKF